MNTRLRHTRHTGFENLEDDRIVCFCCLYKFDPGVVMKLNSKKCKSSKMKVKLQTILNLCLFDDKLRKKYEGIVSKHNSVCRSCYGKLEKAFLLIDLLDESVRYILSGELGVKIPSRPFKKHILSNDIKGDNHWYEQSNSNEQLKSNEDFSTVCVGLFNNHLYSDVTILMENDKKLFGHKVILSLRSVDWAVENFEESENIDLSDLRYDVANALIYWVYTGTIDFTNLNDDDYIQLYTAASKFKLQGLCQSCQTAMMLSINIDNYMKYYHTAEEMCLQVLKNVCLEFMAHHKIKIKESSVNNEEESMNIFFSENEEDDDDQNYVVDDVDNMDNSDDTEKDEVPDADAENEQNDELLQCSTCNQYFLSLSDLEEHTNTTHINHQKKISLVVETDLLSSSDPGEHNNTTHLEEHTNTSHLNENTNTIHINHQKKITLIVKTNHSIKESSNSSRDSEDCQSQKNVNEKELDQEDPTQGNVNEKEFGKEDPQGTDDIEYLQDHNYSNLENEIEQASKVKRKNRKNPDLNSLSSVFEGYMEIIPGPSPFKCTFCDFNFSNKVEIHSHLTDHIRALPVKCPHCRERYPTRNEFRRHYNKVHAKKNFQCKACSKILQTRSSLVRHIECFHEKDSNMIQCEICGKSYSTVFNLKKHQKYHLSDSERPYQCKICSKGFTCGSYFRIHQRSHTGEKPYGCSLCGKSYNHVSTYHKHMKYVHTQVLCGLCGKSFMSKYLLKSHSMEHSEDLESKFKCDFCGRCCRTRQRLYNHISIRHRNLQNHVQYIEEEKDSKNCKLCGEIISDQEALQKHISDHAGFQQQSCSFCLQLFDNQILLAQHTVKEHPDDCEVKKTPTGKLLQCEMCHQTFKKLCNLSAHRKRHMNPDRGSYHCQLCGEKFVRKKMFQIHLRKHRAQKDFLKEDTVHRSGKSSEELMEYIESYMEKAKEICDICGKGFYRRSALRLHMSSHTNVRTHSCELCGKTYKTSRDLSNHKIIHTRGKNYKCTVCRYATHLRSGLKKHMKIHSTERPHQCEMCGKSFKMKRTLQDHIKTHFGVKPHQCEVCFKDFILKSALTAHKRTHTGEKPYKCSVCFKEFGDSRSRKRHETNNHGINHDRYLIPQPHSNMTVSMPTAPPAPPQVAPTAAGYYDAAAVQLVNSTQDTSFDLTTLMPRQYEHHVQEQPHYCYN